MQKEELHRVRVRVRVRVRARVMGLDVHRESQISIVHRQSHISIVQHRYSIVQHSTA